MKSVILIYQTDAWLSTSSRDLVAVATTPAHRDRLVRRFLTKELYDKPDRETLQEAMREIADSGQTQCLSEKCDLEILCETWDVNEIVY